MKNFGRMRIRTTSGMAMAAVLVLGWLGDRPAQAVTITEFAAGGTPIGITRGPDENMWFTENLRTGVSKITSSGTVTAYTAGTNGMFPSAIVAGPDNRLWFTKYPNTIAAVTTAGTLSEYSQGITPDSVPRDITVGPDDNLWFTEDARKLGRITTTGVVTEFSSGITHPPSSIVEGADGHLWFIESSTGQSRIGRSSTNGVVDEFFAGMSAGTQLGDITAGPDGALWFTEVDGRRIGRITTAGIISERPATATGTPDDIIAGPDGNLWFTVHAANGSWLARMTPSGDVREFKAGVTTGSDFRDIATGPDGTIWLSVANGRRIVRVTLDPPSAITGAAVDVAPSAARLTGSVDPRDYETAYTFEYGPTTAYGESTPVGHAGDGGAATAVGTALSGLTPQTTYHYRLTATSPRGTTHGLDATFTTPPRPQPEPEPSPTPEPTAQLLACPTVLRGDGRPIGVTVNGATRYTRSPRVELEITAPDGAASVLMSNDGGFARPTAVPVNAAQRYPWTLESSGLERLPKTVYVRFAGTCGFDPSQTYQDDIILDQTPPRLVRATVTRVSPAKGRGAATLTLAASDNASGLGAAQVRNSRRARARIFTLRYRRRIRLEGARARAKAVRVRDRAGNYSAWKPIKR